MVSENLAQSFTPFLHELVALSSAAIEPYFALPTLRVESKSDASPVTIADRRAEELMRAHINKVHPSHGIIGEEFGSERPDAEFVWVLDPIDGTISFAHACPLFGTLICLLHRGRPILGAINQPILKQLCIGDGREATLNGRSIRVRKTATLAEATLLCTDPLAFARFQSEERFRSLMSRVRIVRTWGDCYGYLLLASGYADIMLDPIMNSWDLLALIPIIRGAGGAISGWKGEEVEHSQSCVAALPHLHNEVLAILNG